MLTLFSFIVLLAAITGLAFFRVSLKISTAVMGGLLFLISVAQLAAWWLLIPLWLIYIGIALIFNVTNIRLKFFTAPLLKYFRKVLPPMSATEKIALEAGDVWWEGELFRGQPDWKKLLAMPKPALSIQEQDFLDKQVETLCTMLNDWEIVHQDGDLPKEVWDYLKEQGFFGLVIAREYGGHGFSALAHSTIVSKIASRSMSAAVNTMVPNSLGPAELIALYGTEEQKHYFLPRLAKGIDIPCFGLTAPQAGSDATAITDTGIVCRGEFNEEEIIGIRLNWNKRYITLAPIATILGLAFKMYDPEHLLGAQEDLGITLCLVPTNHPGVEIGRRHSPLRLAFMNGPTEGQDVFIPLDWIIGGAEMRGKGWQMLMECLSVGRGISLPALGTATAKLCYRSAGAYARVRHQFKLPIGKLEGIQEALARIGGFTYICEATRLMSASAVDQNIKPSLASAITKYHLTELARKTLNDAMDIHAGKGIQLGPKNYLGLIHDAIPTSITVEGANILTRNLIIFGQGAMRCHPYIQLEMEAAKDKDLQQGLLQFDKLFSGHLAYSLGNFARNLIYGLSGGVFIHAPKSPVALYYRQLTRMSTALALTADIAMALLGGDLKRKERLSARLGDVLSYLYLASSVLRYYENKNQPASDLPLVNWSIQWCLANIQIAFDEFFANFPYRWLATILRRMIFPWGRAYIMPRDRLGQRIAEDMQKMSELRMRLTQYCYVSQDNEDGLGCLENAWQAILAAEPVKLKVTNGVRSGRIPRLASFAEQIDVASKAGILTAEEIQLLQTADDLANAAIAVDEFDAKELSRVKKRTRTMQ